MRNTYVVFVTALVLASPFLKACSGSEGSDAEEDGSVPEGDANITTNPDGQVTGQADGGVNDAAQSDAVQPDAASGMDGTVAVDAVVGNTTTVGVWQRMDPPVNLSAFGNEQYGFHSLAGSGSTIYVGTSYEGLWKTTNGGATWTKTNTGTNGAMLNQGRLWQTVAEPNNANVVYTTPGYGGGGLYKSTDGGVNWTQMLPKAITDQTHVQPYSIDMDPANAQHLIVTTHQAWPGSQASGVIESSDGGNTWTIRAPQSGWTFGGSPIARFVTSTTWILSTESQGIWRTTNSGATWTSVWNTGHVHGGTNLTHTAGAIYLGVRGSAIRSVDNGATWTQVVPAGNGGVMDVGNDGTHLWAQRSGAQRGAQSSSVAFYVSPINDGVNWTLQPGGQVFTNGPNNMYYDAANRTMWSSNWTEGVWRIRLAEKDAGN